MNKLIIESVKIAGKTALTAGAYCSGAIIGTVGGFWVGNKVIEGTAKAAHFVKRKISDRKSSSSPTTKAVAPKAKTKSTPVPMAPKKSSKPKAKTKKKITEKVVEALQEA